MVADSNPSDIGLQLFTSCGEPGRRALWAAAASAVGDRGGPFPYSSGQVSVYAPQHTHPHPSLADFYLGPNRSQYCYRGWTNRYQGLLPLAKFGMVTRKWKVLCPASAAQLGDLLISKLYPCRLVLCGLSDTLGLLDCVMLP